jgi:molybdopterin molybdotransferase
MLRFTEARQLVIAEIARAFRAPETESVTLAAAAGRVLAGSVCADRDYPPFDRATRDGFAVRSDDLRAVPTELQVIGELRAGAAFEGAVGEGQCVSIMTGAPVPAGADAVVMIEHTQPAAGDAVLIDRALERGANIVLRGSEAASGAPILQAGKRLGYAEVAMLAGVGCACVPVFRRPRVAVLPTGDEIVEVDSAPQPFQIRNSNSYSLQAQVAAAGGEPWPLGIAPDEAGRLREMIEQGLSADLLLLSGGVSVGKYDLVEQVLRELGAEFYFDAVAIQPGRPLVFGQARGRFFFGLPGNPLSTMVTFELFARPAIEMLAGAEATPLVFPRARLAEAVRHQPGLTRFLPAVLAPGESPRGWLEPVVRKLPWQGSGDIAALTRANCFLVVPEDREQLAAGETVSVLLKS